MAAAVHLHPELAARLDLRDGEQVTVRQSGAALGLPVVIDPRIADGCVWIPDGVVGSVGLGANGASVEITRTKERQMIETLEVNIGALPEEVLIVAKILLIDEPVKQTVAYHTLAE